MLDMLKSMMAAAITPPRKPSPGRTPSGAAASPKPVPAQASAPSPRPGVAVQDTVQWGKLGTTIHETHTRTGEALTLLHDLAAPPPSEKPSHIEDILTALTAILESQRQVEMRQDRMEQQIERISNMLRPRAA